MHYYLSLPKGTIKYQTGGWIGSTTTITSNDWGPANPEDVGGWKTGDILTVTAAFDLNPKKNAAGNLPDAKEYHGLSVSALYNPTPQQVTDATNLLLKNAAGILGQGITENTNTPANSTGIYFYDATSESYENIPLTPASRGTLNVIYSWIMKYHLDKTLANQGTKMEFVFGYGDPMSTEVLT